MTVVVTVTTGEARDYKSDECDCTGDRDTGGDRHREEQGEGGDVSGVAPPRAAVGRPVRREGRESRVLRETVFSRRPEAKEEL